MSCERLTADTAALLQTALANGAQDQSVPENISSVAALVKFATL